MLTRIARSSRRLKLAKPITKASIVRSNKFYSTLSSDPSEVYTKLSDTNDPKRNNFFQYSWGSWLKDDKLKKRQRETKFSIEGLALSLETLNQSKLESILPPIEKDGVRILQHNLELLGNTGDSKLIVKSIASIHEGKHNRIYKVTLNTNKELILRIPYKLNSNYAIGEILKSEVATMDFLNLKLGLNVPKVLAYGTNSNNKLESPFILQEFISGELLMKKWHPLLPDSEKDKLLEVIEPIAKFHDSISKIVFTKFGSIYFKSDVNGELQNDVPYDGETDENLINRWRIGPSVEKYIFKNKNKLNSKIVNQFRGPWNASNPIDLMTSVSELELENAKYKLNLIEADAGESKDQIPILKSQIETFENLKKITPSLINPVSKSVKNIEELFNPRLFVPDLDPLNVIQNENGSYFIDFENSVIKPFILQAYPNFIAYNGAKIYNLKEDIPNFEKLDELEKQQYEFMYYKTRNERLWEMELNKNNHDLIAVASPHIKVLKSPYLQAIDLKANNDYLYVEGSIVQLQALWETYVANELVNSKDSKFPIEYDEIYLDDYQSKVSDHQLKVVSSPFNATGGWIPQDMFNALKQQGIIVETENGDYKIETEKVLKKTPEEIEHEKKLKEKEEAEKSK
ncbi:unnamed protein product [Candida verbasci]|uniref:Altered inheritance of mitochondria protein 9, mitochondrial n=1 Tax=Candida verbasci TaxID=1227364 RepID=A0A9W4TVI7_9ASCO|nr:unnamed protein product [Candida verbasci]